jgi:hypothetical protein
MYNADRSLMEFINGVHEFIDAVKKHKHDGFFCCLCQYVRTRGITRQPEGLLDNKNHSQSLV